MAAAFYHFPVLGRFVSRFAAVGIMAPADLPRAVWGLVVERIATLQEIEIHWSLRDLILANDALRIRNAARRRVDPPPPIS